MNTRIVKLILLSFGLLVLVILVVRGFKMKYPVKGEITSPFGNRVHPIKKTTMFHNGIDIGVPSGTPVISPASGKVTNLYWEETGGNQLVIKHNNGYTTGYAHLSSYLVKVGDKVRKGQKIGHTGATGKVTGPHLHLTMRNPKNEYTDPQKHLV